MQKIWLKNYPVNMPEEIDTQIFSSLAEMFEESCQKYAEKPALCSMDSLMSYGKLLKKSRNFAAFLQQKLKLKKGERIALMLPNIMQYPVALFGAWLAGLIVVNVNPLSTQHELVKQLSDAEVETIVVLANFAHVLEKAIPETKIKHVIITEIADLCWFFKAKLINYIVRKIKKKVPIWGIPGAILFKKALRQGARLQYKKTSLTPDDIALLQYTGGTTGVSKGAVLSHGNLLANIEQCKIWMQGALRSGQEISMTILPLYHIFALTACCLTFFRFGALQILIANPRDVPKMVKNITKYPITIFIGLTTLFKSLINNAAFRNKINFATLELTVGGGMAVQSAIATEWQDLTGNVILQGYGLTEASPVVSMNPTYQKEFNGSIGLPLPSTEISIRNKQGNEVALGEEGELWVRGPQVMQGYWQNSEETKKVLLPDGWLRTGDIVIMDQKGFLYLVDRKKDIIVVAGYNVYPNEVEEVIAKHPAVAEVAVIGEPSTYAGEIVKAYVVRKDESLTKEKLVAFCKERLMSYKVPKRIEFRQELPKSHVGKVLRRALRDEVVKK